MHKGIIKYLELVLGMILIAISFNLFTSPLKIAVGGTNGLAIVIEAIFGIDEALFIEIFYIFALVLNIIIFGIKDTKNVIFCSIIYPIFVSLFSNISNYIILNYNDKTIMFLVTSVLLGAGNGLIFKNGHIGGGLDVIKKILNKKLKIQMGVCSFVIDAAIVITGGFIFGLKSVLYAIIILYISSKITDKLILGISKEKMFYIMTRNPDEVRSVIVKELKCGVTELEAIGGYTDTKNHILMCVISTRDYIKLEKRVNNIDPNAFFLITDSYHMYHGRGYYGINKSKRFRKKI